MRVAVSTFAKVQAAAMDAVEPTTNLDTSMDVGLFFSGGSKAVSRRSLITFDLASALSGSALVAGDLVTGAQLDIDVLTIVGASSEPATMHRVTRADWVESQMTWNIYKTANNWTTAGGDIDATTPTPKAFTMPAATGAYTLSGIGTFVQDALDNRSKLFNVRLKLDDEANDGVNRLTTFDQPTAVLSVTYTPTAAATIERRRLMGQVV